MSYRINLKKFFPVQSPLIYIVTGALANIVSLLLEFDLFISYNQPGLPVIVFIKCKVKLHLFGLVSAEHNPDNWNCCQEGYVVK